MSKYLYFIKHDSMVFVSSKNTKEPLGVIDYYEPWKQFVFSPEEYTAFSHECLNDICLKLIELNQGGKQ